MSNRRIHGLAVDVRVAPECQGLLLFLFLFFFTVLNKLRNCIQAYGDQNISFVTRLVCRIWFGYVTEMDFLTLNLE